MSVITVSRETGSLGNEIARFLAVKTQYSFLDRAAMEAAINDESFPDIPLERFDEHSPSFWENFTSGKDIYLDRLRTSILQSASKGKAVILGRGGQFILKDVSGVFRVRIIANQEVRIARLTEILRCDRSTAERYCRKSDHDRSGFNRFFFGGYWANPASYDLTLCTDEIDALTAAKIIIKAYHISQSDKKIDDEILNNRLLAQKVRNRILYNKKIPIDLLEIEADKGRITLRGTVMAKENIAACKKAAAAVEAVSEVENEVYFIYPVMT